MVTNIRRGIIFYTNIFIIDTVSTMVNRKGGCNGRDQEIILKSKKKKNLVKEIKIGQVNNLIMPKNLSKDHKLQEDMMSLIKKTLPAADKKL